ncbi:MAG: hypothetical protein M5R42_06645 [Rhodocyclaceae bacterium]|nr:hypothetical protein [Rhodocyclaceae bacterium]
MGLMSIAVVTETHPPEVNGVAMTIGRLIAGLRGRGHRVSVLRPRQSREDRGAMDDLLFSVHRYRVTTGCASGCRAAAR